MTSAAIVQKLWNHCNVLRDDGMSYGGEPFDHYRHMLEELGKEKGLLGLIFVEAREIRLSLTSVLPSE
jgi:type I restriction enzyme M protein